MSVSVPPSGSRVPAIQTYRKEEVHNIHQTKYHVGHIVKTVDIGGGEEGAGDNVVGEHLVVVLASLLDMNDEDGLDEESQFDKQIPLHQTGHGTSWPFIPDSAEIEPVV